MITEWAWLVPAVMGVSAVLIVALGRRLPVGGAEIGITAIGACFVFSLVLAGVVFSGNVDASVEAEEALHHSEETAAARAGIAAAGPRLFAAEAEEGEEPLSAGIPEGLSEFRTQTTLDLAPLGGSLEGGSGTVIPIGQRVDGLTIMMFLLVTFVSLMVHVYSLGYMHGDPRFTWYYALLSMFTGSMLLLVIADNLLQLLVGWELVGVCSFLLIGFWWEEKKNSDAAIKAFLTTKLGDVGLITGVVTLWAMFGTFDIAEIIAAVEAGGYSEGLLTFGVLALFLGAVGKSAQFPLHTWLPDAMAGPTPVSALIHAATMVTAGGLPLRPHPPGLPGLGHRGRRRGDHRRHHAVRDGAARDRAGRREARARVLDRLPARLHGDGTRLQLHRRHLPPVHPTASSRRCCSSAPARSSTRCTATT